MSKKRPHKRTLTTRTLALAKRRFASGGLTGYSPGAQSQKLPGVSDIDYEHYGEGPEKLFLGDRSPPAVSLAPRVDKFVPKNPTNGGGNNSLLPALGLGALAGKDLYDWYQDSQNPANSHIGGTGSQADIEAWNDAQLQGLDAPDGSALPGWWDAIKGAGQGALGAVGLYGGVKQGGVEGTGAALSGASDISGALDPYGLGAGEYGEAAGGAGNVLSGINEGGVKGYGQAAVGGAQVADSFGYDQFGNYVPIVGGLLSAYQGINSGDPGGYATAAGGAYQAANAAGLVAAPAAGAGTFAAGSGAAGALGALGTAAPYIAAGFALADLGNKALGTGREGPGWEAFGQGMGDLGITQVAGRVPMIKLPNGQTVRFGTEVKGQQLFSQGLRDAYLGGGPERTQQILAAIPPDAKTGADVEKWWKDNRAQFYPPGYKFARGGSVLQEGNMNRRPMGGLSALSPPTLALDNPRSYYRYGASPQPQVRPMPVDPRRMPQFMQPSPLQRAAGGGIGFGYNAGGETPAELVRGPGSGRSDDIPARLSDGEYIMDAETVALLGDGSTDEGARRLDELRKRLRMHKGKELSKGKFSSAAKQPEQYLGE
jgi:hypothetical protein